MTTIDEQLVKYLTDAHAIEAQALAQLKPAPDVAGEPTLAAVLREHRVETEEHERLVHARLAAHDAAPSTVKEVVMRLGGKGFVLFARSQPDTPGKLAAHAYSYEHLEVAAYELLRRIAERAGDEETVAVAERIGAQEVAAGDRIAETFDAVVEASLRAKGTTASKQEVIAYLTDAHAIEAQAITLLERGPALAGASELAAVYEEHLAETREQQSRIEARLDQLGGSPSRLKDAAMTMGAINWGFFFQAHPDTPGKLAAFAYAFEHLEIAAYELLVRVAEGAGDVASIELGRSILEQERGAARRIGQLWDRAAEASLRDLDVPMAG